MQNQARCDIMLLGCLKHYLQRVKFRLNRSGVPPLERFFFFYMFRKKSLNFKCSYRWNTWSRCNFIFFSMVNKIYRYKKRDNSPFCLFRMFQSVENTLFSRDCYWNRLFQIALESNCFPNNPDMGKFFPGIAHCFIFGVFGEQ